MCQLSIELQFKNINKYIPTLKGWEEMQIPERGQGVKEGPLGGGTQSTQLPWQRITDGEA